MVYNTETALEHSPNNQFCSRTRQHPQVTEVSYVCWQHSAVLVTVIFVVTLTLTVTLYVG